MNALSNVVFTTRFLVERSTFFDFADYGSLVTANVLIAIAAVQSYKQFSGRAIECLTPDNIPFDGSEEYAEQYCFAADTYYVPMKSTVADLQAEDRRERKISYYQWVPFFLLLSAAFFRLPSMLWKHFADYSGIRIHQIIKLASDANNIKPDIKAANIEALRAHLMGALRFHRKLDFKQIKLHRFRPFNIQYSPYYVSVLYLVTKFCYLLNVGTQLYLMNMFLGTSKHRFYGFGAILDLLNGTTWEQSGVFPRVSLCDFEVRVMGNVQEYTIQCVLVINIFNEKIFIFLWFWYIFLLAFTLNSFIYWSIVIFLPCYNESYIAKHLQMSVKKDDHMFETNKEKAENHIRQFVRTYLRADGMLAIRMISTYSGVIFGTELVCALWESYSDIEEGRRQDRISIGDPMDIEKQMNKDNDFRALKLRKVSRNAYSNDFEKVPPPSPPSEVVRALLKQGTSPPSSRLDSL